MHVEFEREIDFMGIVEIGATAVAIEWIPCSTIQIGTYEYRLQHYNKPR